jgi:hypothetical protein
MLPVIVTTIAINPKIVQHNEKSLIFDSMYSKKNSKKAYDLCNEI